MATRQDESQYILEQGDQCVPIRPMRLQLPVETFYEYQLPQEHVSDANGAVSSDTVPFASAGTTDLQRGQTSILFLYQGPEGMSLVVVHGSVQASDAGAVTFRIDGLPEDGRWVVKDDFYRNPDTGNIASSNYDQWNVNGDDHRIDWTWGSAGTDGGVFHELGDDFEVVIDPAFNEDAALYDQHYEGTVTDWEFLSGVADGPERLSLNMDEPIRITTGECEGGTASDRGDTSKATALEDFEDGVWPADWARETRGYSITNNSLVGSFAVEVNGSLGYPDIRKPTVDTPRGHTYTVRTIPGSSEATPTLLTNCQHRDVLDDSYAALLYTGLDELHLQVRSGGSGTRLEAVPTSQSLRAGREYAIALDVGSDWVQARAFSSDGTIAATDRHTDTTHRGGTPVLYTDGTDSDVDGTLYDQYAQWPLETL
jgi:hypothetical protein